MTDYQANCEKFVETFRHVLMGMILDGMRQRDGAHLAMWVQSISAKSEQLLTQIYQRLIPQPPVSK